MSGLGPQLKELRNALSLGQIAFAKALDVDQTALAKWESGARPIPLAAVMKIADIAPVELKKKWLDAAGLSGPPEKGRKNDNRIRTVPLLKDIAVLGTVKASQEEEAERMLELPRDWLPPAGVLYAVRSPDDGMSPVIEKGFVVVVDTSRRDPKLLKDTIVVAKDQGGAFIRWLRRDMGLDLLVPSDLRSHQMKQLAEKPGQGVLGAVVLWVGKPSEQ